MSDLQNTRVRIELVEPAKSEKGPLKIHTSDKSGKYIIWKTKQDGTESAAYTFVKKLGLDDFGQTEYEIGYDEADRSFTNKEGKNITFKQRTIRAIRAV